MNGIKGFKRSICSARRLWKDFPARIVPTSLPDLALADTQRLQADTLQTFACNVCNREYTREEHLIRHQQAKHTGERPHVCAICGKTFARQDVLARHVAGIHKEAVTNPKRSIRNAQACEQCAKQKLKCDGAKPCARCADKERACTYKPITKRRKTQQDEENGDNQLIEGSEVDSGSTPIHAANLQDLGMHIEVGTESTLEPSLPIQSLQANGVRFDIENDGTPSWTQSDGLDLLSQVGADVDGGLSLLFETTHDPMSSILAFINDPAFNELLSNDQSSNSTGLTPAMLPVDSLSPGAPTPVPNTETFDNVATPTASIGGPPLLEGNRDVGLSRPPSPPPHYGNKTWAFSWQPKASDSIINPTIVPRKGPVSASKYRKMTLVGQHKILSVIHYVQLGPGEYARLYNIMSRISLDVYNDFIALYWENVHPLYPMLHAPTTNPDSLHGNLLAMIVAAGALHHPSDGSVALGKAVAEFVNLAIGALIRDDLRLSREKQTAQSLLLYFIVTQWCGDPKLLEMGQAYRATWTTIVRRMHMLDDVPLQVTSNASLHERWSAWVKYEGRRRTGFATFCADIEVATLLGLTPIFSVVDVQCTIPCAEELWEAPDAESWAAIYDRGFSNPSFPSILTKASCGMLPADLGSYGRYIMLQLAHVVIRCWRQLRTISPGIPVGTVEPLLDGFRGVLTLLSNTPKPLEISCAISYHIARLSLMVSFDDLQTIAGRGTLTASLNKRNQAIAAMQNTKAHSARKAAWHAGQVVRLASLKVASSPTKSMSLFLATLILWLYSLSVQELPTSHEPLYKVVLDADGPQNISPWLEVGGVASMNGIEDLSSSIAPQLILKQGSDALVRTGRAWRIGITLSEVISRMARSTAGL